MSLIINRLRILSQGIAAYDEVFHEGVNIIRGQNGSGKSTIADFIFFILGGEFNDWKDAATRCDEVQCEIETPKGKLSLRRYTDSKTSPVYIYFGDMKKAENHALDGWQSFPIRRHGGNESISQVLFRSLNIPEARSEGASNITMHQLMRLCYSDQRTPASRLFRFEPFDTQNIREAVGDLICGISGYELFELNLTIRDLDKKFTEANSNLSALLKSLPSDDAFRTTSSIDGLLADLSSEKEQLEKDIKLVDEISNISTTEEYLEKRQKVRQELSKERGKLQKFEEQISKFELEKKEIINFLSYLTELHKKLDFSEASLNVLGSIEFIHCPSCGADIDRQADDNCILCKNAKDPEKERSRYNQIRLDLEIQIRESNQLLTQKELELKATTSDHRLLRSSHGTALSNFDLEYSGSNTPRDAYLAERTGRIGYINAEIEFLTRSYNIASEIEELTEKKYSLKIRMDELKQRIYILEREAKKRRKIALLKISSIAVSLLHADCKRQEEFETADTVTLNFNDDAINVDGKMNFAESSNVFLKNTAILSLFLTAGEDPNFYHPRFLLFDNIEDKGMEVERSHLFQKLIVERATELEIPFQIIFTTSMMNPKLELDDYVIGPRYAKDNKVLNLNQ